MRQTITGKEFRELVEQMNTCNLCKKQLTSRDKPTICLECLEIKSLKPCPFCGNKAKTYNSTDNKWGLICSDPTETCILGCGTQDIYDTEEEAIKAWNTRYDKKE